MVDAKRAAGREDARGSRGVTIRPLRRTDIPGAVALRRTIWPDDVTTPESYAWGIDHADPSERARRWVAVADRRVVGLGVASRATWTSEPVAFAHVGVEPAWRGRGIGSRLFELVDEHVAALGVLRTSSGIERGDTASARFLAERGFRHARDLQVWSLDPKTVAAAELPARRAAAEGDGFRLVPIRELIDRPEDLYRLHVEVGRDIPADDPIEPAYAAWRTDELDTPLFDPDASFCVLAGNEPIAFTWIRVDREGHRAQHGLTGTLRAYRHRGLAHLVKLASIVWLADQGVTVLYTDNDTTNRDMLALNEQLGFQPLSVIELWSRRSDVRPDPGTGAAAR